MKESLIEPGRHDHSQLMGYISEHLGQLAEDFLVPTFLQLIFQLLVQPPSLLGLAESALIHAPSHVETISPIRGNAAGGRMRLLDETLLLQARQGIAHGCRTYTPLLAAAQGLRADRSADVYISLHQRLQNL